MTTQYWKIVSLHGIADLHGVARIRTFVQAKVGVKGELVQIETDDRKIAEWSLEDAIHALDPIDRRSTAKLVLSTGRTDDLVVTVTLHPAQGRLRQRRGMAHAVVEGTDEVSVLGLAACLERFRNQGRYHDPPTQERRRVTGRPGTADPPPTKRRTWWWQNVTAGALAQVAGTMLFGLLSLLVSMLLWAFVR
jgi:hypothetical protein